MNKKLQLKQVLTKICLILFAVGLCTQSYANLNNLLLTQINESKLTLKLDNVSIKSILYEVQKQTKINFIYTDSELSSIAKKSVNVKNATVV